MAVQVRTIQMRRGLAADFDPSKMVPGEWAVSQDNEKIYMCFTAGRVVELSNNIANVYKAEAWAVGTENGVPVDNTNPAYHNNSKYYSGLTSADAASTATDASNANTDALKSEGFAVGEQNGTPVSSGTYYENNSKYYCQKAEEYKDEAAAIVGIGIATTTTPGIVKPDGSSITVESDGTIHGTSYEYDSTTETLTLYNVASH